MVLGIRGANLIIAAQKRTRPILRGPSFRTARRQVVRDVLASRKGDRTTEGTIVPESDTASHIHLLTRERPEITSCGDEPADRNTKRGDQRHPCCCWTPFVEKWSGVVRVSARDADVEVSRHFPRHFRASRGPILHLLTSQSVHIDGRSPCTQRRQHCTIAEYLHQKLQKSMYTCEKDDELRVQVRRVY
jgi:hypothetical protein